MISMRSLAAGAQEPNAPFPFEDRYEEFLAAFNTGDSTALRGFIGERYASRVDAGAEARRWLRWFDLVGPLEHTVVVAADESRFRAYASGTVTGAWVELTLRPDRSESDRLRGIALGMGLHPGLRYVTPGWSSDSQLPLVLSAYLRRMAEEDYFSGIVIVARNGEVLFQESTGYAARGRGERITPATRFDVASVTKVFTAAAVLRLVQQGRLGLDDLVANLLPDIPIELPAGLTVNQLLTHTGGLGRGAFDESLEYPRERLTVDDLLELMVAPIEFAPGTDVRYSNTGFAVLGKLVERISGEDYYRYVQREVFDRAGMGSSGFLELDRDPPQVAAGYTRYRLLPGDSVTYEFGPRRNSIFLASVRGTPAGGSYHTAADLLAFLEAVRRGDLLDQQHTTLFLDDHVEIPAEPDASVREAYGFGWSSTTLGSQRYLVRSGGSNGASARMDYQPTSGLQVIVLSNYESIADQVAGHIWDLLLSGGIGGDSEN